MLEYPVHPALVRLVVGLKTRPVRTISREELRKEKVVKYTLRIEFGTELRPIMTSFGPSGRFTDHDVKVVEFEEASDDDAKKRAEKEISATQCVRGTELRKIIQPMIEEKSISVSLGKN